jgi:hypothetical protein
MKSQWEGGSGTAPRPKEICAPLFFPPCVVIFEFVATVAVSAVDSHKSVNN